MFPLKIMYPIIYLLQIHSENMHELRLGERKIIPDLLIDDRNSQTKGGIMSGRVEHESGQFGFQVYTPKPELDLIMEKLT